MGAIRLTRDKNDIPKHATGSSVPPPLEFLNHYAHPLLLCARAGVWGIRDEGELPG